jgi:ketosteroid isomerase-like protein
MSSSTALVRGLYESFARGDVPAVIGALDPNVQWNEAEGFLYADRNPYVGPEAVLRGVFMRIGEEIENFSVSPVSFIDGGSAVAVEGRYTGRMKATGMPVDAQFVHVWELSNGKVVRFQQYTDTAQWGRAAGQLT